MPGRRHRRPGAWQAAELRPPQRQRRIPGPPPFYGRSDCSQPFRTGSSHVLNARVRTLPGATQEDVKRASTALLPTPAQTGTGEALREDPVIRAAGRAAGATASLLRLLLPLHAGFLER